MKILLLADFHFCENWYSWLLREKADLCVIAGDLLDGYHDDGLLPQMLAVQDWCGKFPGNLAISSGNHDGNIELGGREVSPWEFASDEIRGRVHALLSYDTWMDSLAFPNVVTDGQSRLLVLPSGNIVVTTIPFFPGPRGLPFVVDLWGEGARLRRECECPWIVVNHEPPCGTLVGGETGDPELVSRIQEFSPDFVVSGHVHGQPYRGSFVDKVGSTWCFNPGRPVLTRAIRAKRPNHILLDLGMQTATWRATPNVGRVPIDQTVVFGKPLL